MKLIYCFCILLLASCNSGPSGKLSNHLKTVTERFPGDSVVEKNYYEDGTLSDVKSFKNGKQSGEQIHYGPDGKKRALMTFRDGIRHGPTFEYHGNGQVAFEGEVVNGEFEGQSKWYFENGKLNFIGNRHLGKDTGWWYYFNRNGDTIERKYISFDTLVIDKKSAVFYYPDSLQIQKRMKAIGEENFRIGADDYIYSVNTSVEYLEKQGLPVVDFKNAKYLKFIMARGRMQLVKVDTLEDLWGMYLFDPNKKPYYADITMIEEEYAKYFK